MLVRVVLSGYAVHHHVSRSGSKADRCEIEQLSGFCNFQLGAGPKCTANGAGLIIRLAETPLP